MDEKESSKKKLIDYIRPPVETPSEIRSVLRFAILISGIFAILFLIVAIIAVFMIIYLFFNKRIMGQLDLFYSGLFIILFIIYPILWLLVWQGLRKMRLIAAVGGLFLPLIPFIARTIVSGDTFFWNFNDAYAYTSLIGVAVSRVVVVALSAWAFGNAIRATLAYKRVAKLEADSLTLQQ